MPARRAVLLAVGTSALAAAAPAIAGPRFRTEVQWVDPVTAVAPDVRAAGALSNILYLNRCVGGCSIEKAGQNDARTDRSTIPVQNGISVVSEFVGGDVVFDAVVDCVREVYGPYDVVVVTEDPGAEVTHHEAVVAGLPGDLGRDGTIGGIAPASCEPLDNVISYTFANLYPDDVEQLCWTVAQESAHSFGLPNHSFDCSDPMTYLGPATGDVCGRKYFRDRDFACGEFREGPCSCGVDRQNSHARLTEVFGPGTTPDPSVVEILLPADGDEVAENFDVFFTAVNPRQVDRLELVINGTAYDAQAGHSYARRADDYNFAAPDLPDGYLDVEVVAYDDLGTPGRATITVLKGEPCSSDATCFEHQACAEGRCAYPAPTGVPGDECLYDQFCIEGGCFEHDGDRRCATPCDGEAGGCPEDFACVSTTSGGGACFPADAGGCCAVAGGQRSGPPYLAIGLFAAALLVLRRRRA